MDLLPWCVMVSCQALISWFFPSSQVLVKECKNLRELRVGMKSNPGTRYEITDSWVYQVINFSTKIEVLKVQSSRRERESPIR